MLRYRRLLLLLLRRHFCTALHPHFICAIPLLLLQRRIIGLPVHDVLKKFKHTC
jgi:hypothetical protein